MGGVYHIIPEEARVLVVEVSITRKLPLCLL
jgi:hypothetical protein